MCTTRRDLDEMVPVTDLVTLVIVHNALVTGPSGVHVQPNDLPSRKAQRWVDLQWH